MRGTSLSQSLLAPCDPAQLAVAHRLQPIHRMTNLDDLSQDDLESIEGGDFIGACNPWPTDPYPPWRLPPYNPFPMPDQGCW